MIFIIPNQVDSSHLYTEIKFKSYENYSDTKIDDQKPN